MKKIAYFFWGVILMACYSTVDSTIDSSTNAAINTNPAMAEAMAEENNPNGVQAGDVTVEATALPETGAGIEPDGEEAPEAVLRQAPFRRGVNFTQWFEAGGAEKIQFSRFTEQDFADAKSLGADVIRLPVNMHAMTLGGPEYTLDPLLLKFLDTAVDWAEKNQLYIIIDNHSFDPVAPTDSGIDAILLKVWAQLAERYKDRGEYLVYEILNEPHGIPDARWGEIQGAAINTIRDFDKTHAIIVGGTDYNSIGKLSALPEYPDTNLIYTFHFYDPHVFTHQGASWGSPSLASLSGVPFPADQGRMPATPDDLKGTWVEGALRNYGRDAAYSALRASLDKTVKFSRERDVPVFCGEFGVYMISSPPEDRIAWYEFVTRELEGRGIARTSWDYFAGFGLFRTPYGTDFNANLNVHVARALMFTPPPQRDFIEEPINSGFTIYDDLFKREYSVGFWGDDSDFSVYDARAAEGEYAIRWGNADQYDAFWIAFDQNGDLSALAAGGYCLEFRAKTFDAVRFDVRFVNPEHSSSIPWRIRYSLDESMLPPDGEWHTIRIPLADMREHGAWVNATKTWLSPEGKFTWKDVRQLDFVAEEADLKGRWIWLDSIRITFPE